MSENPPKDPYSEETVTIPRSTPEIITLTTGQTTTLPSESGAVSKETSQGAAVATSKTTGTLRDTGALKETYEVTLIVRGLIERFVIRKDGEIKLGRFEPSVRQTNELDLTPYGAVERGVSRFHARIHIENNQFFVTDKNSTNGTFVRKIRVVPNVPTPIRKGEELILGRLPIQVMFR